AAPRRRQRAERAVHRTDVRNAGHRFSPTPQGGTRRRARAPCGATGGAASRQGPPDGSRHQCHRERDFRGTLHSGGDMTATIPGTPAPTSGPRLVRAPRGCAISCLGWQQEAALRMLMNNLDPEVAERPDDLVVYGGTGRAARSWEAFDALVRTLTTLDHDETLLVQSGKPVGVFRTHASSPRVLIANANLVGRWATWEV